MTEIPSNPSAMPVHLLREGASLVLQCDACGLRVQWSTLDTDTQSQESAIWARFADEAAAQGCDACKSAISRHRSIPPRRPTPRRS